MLKTHGRGHALLGMLPISNALQKRSFSPQGQFRRLELSNLLITAQHVLDMRTSDKNPSRWLGSHTRGSRDVEPKFTCTFRFVTFSGRVDVKVLQLPTKGAV